VSKLWDLFNKTAKDPLKARCR